MEYQVSVSFAARRVAEVSAMVPSCPRNPLRIGLFAACAAIGMMPAGLNAQPSPTRPASPAATLDRYGDPLPPGAVMRLGTVKYRQDSSIYRIAYAPDGKHFVTDGEDSILRVWDAATGQVVRRIDPAVGALADFAITSRGKLVMALGTTLEPGRGFVHNVTMTELETGRPVDVGSWPQEGIEFEEVALCPDRQLIAIGRDSQAVRILDAWTGAEICRFQVGNREVERIAFTRDGKRLAIQTSGDIPNPNRELRICDLDQKKETRVINKWGFDLDALVFSPDGSTVAVTTLGDLCVWLVETGERIPFRHALVDSVSYSADGRTLAGIAYNGRLALFDLPSRRPTSSFDTTTRRQTEVALSPDGQTLVANGGSMVLHSWEIKARRDRFAMPDAHCDSLSTLFITSDGKAVVTGAEDGSIRVWDPRDGRQVRRWGPPGLSMSEPPVLTSDGKLLVLSGDPFQEKRLITWDIADGRELSSRPLESANEYDRTCATGLADAGKTFLILTREGKIRGWDLVQGKAGAVSQPRLWNRAGPGGHQEQDVVYVMSATFLAGGKKLAALVGRGGLQMIDMASGKELFHTEGGDLIVASPDERILAVSHRVSGVRLRRHRRYGHDRSSAGFSLTSAVSGRSGSSMPRPGERSRG
jgi:WD40 repeat protein